MAMTRRAFELRLEKQVKALLSNEPKNVVAAFPWLAQDAAENSCYYGEATTDGTAYVKLRVAAGNSLAYIAWQNGGSVTYELFGRLPSNEEAQVSGCATQQKADLLNGRKDFDYLGLCDNKHIPASPDSNWTPDEAALREFKRLQLEAWFPPKKKSAA